MFTKLNIELTHPCVFCSNVLDSNPYCDLNKKVLTITQNNSLVGVLRLSTESLHVKHTVNVKGKVGWLDYNGEKRRGERGGHFDCHRKYME